MLTACQTTVSKQELEQMVDELYQRMPQEERIAQLQSMYMDDLFDEQGKLDTVKCKELIPYGIGHFSQFCMQKPRDPNELRDRVAAVQEWLMTKTPNGIPALFHEEVFSTKRYCQVSIPVVQRYIHSRLVRRVRLIPNWQN